MSPRAHCPVAVVFITAPRRAGPSPAGVATLIGIARETTRYDVRMRRSIVTASIVSALMASAAGHELWVTAHTWRAEPGASVTILTHVGGRFPNPDSFTTPDRIESVRLIGPASDDVQKPALRREGDSLAADVRLPATPGTYVAIVTVKPRAVEKPADVFAAHLEHQGLDHVREDRARRGESDKPARERYSRYGKTLLRVGIGGGEAATKPAGLKIELVPLDDPTALRPGDRLRLRLLYDGQPIAGTLVGAIYASADSKPDEWPFTARTDGSGDVAFTLENPGPWLIRAVHMVRREGETGPQAADWETYWASLTFALQGHHH